MNAAAKDELIVHTYYPEAPIDPMDYIIAAAVSEWNTAIIDRA